MAAARTPSAVSQQSIGSMILYIVTIDTCVNNDSWVSGLTNVRAYWGNTDANATTAAGFNVSYTASTGTFVFDVGTDSGTATLFVLAGGPS